MTKNYIQPQCTIQQARDISQTVYTDAMCKISRAYYETFKKTYEDTRDILWTEKCSLTDIFIMGYVSGVRAERAKRKRT